MASIDFRADQIRTGAVIGTSASLGATPRVLFYSVAAASDLRGGIDPLKFNTSGIGTDVFFYVSGSIKKTNTTLSNMAVFGGDTYFSGSLYFPSGSFNTINDQGAGSPTLSVILTPPTFLDSVITAACSFVVRAANGLETILSVPVAGGSIGLFAGTGSHATSALTGAVGGSVLIAAGTGGNGASALNAAGPGGSYFVSGGNGGAGIGGSGGRGGSINYTAGSGGTSFSSFAGIGGNVNIRAGAGGTTTVGTYGNGGDVFIAAGTGAGAGAVNGTVYIGSGSSLPAASRYVSLFVSGSPGSFETTTKGTALFGGDVAASGTIVGLNSIVVTYAGNNSPNSPLGPNGGLTASLATNLIGFGSPYNVVWGARDRTDTHWMSAFIFNDNGLAGNNLSIGDILGGAFSGNPRNSTIEFFVSGVNATGTAPMVQFSPAVGSYFSGSFEFVSGGVRIGTRIADPGTGNLTVSGTTVGLGSIVAIPAGNPPGNLTANLAANIVSFGMPYQTAFATRDKFDATWLSAMLYADGPSQNYLCLGDIVGALFSGNANSRGFQFFSSASVGTTQEMARFDRINGGWLSGSMIFPQGISGSHQRLVDGTPAFVPGGGITITTQSNGAIAISASAIVQRATLAALGTSTQVSAAYQVMGRFYYDPTEWNVTGKQFYWKAIFASSDNTTTCSVAFYNATPGTGSYIAINGSSKLTTATSTPSLVSANTNGAVTNFNPAIAALIEVHASVSSSATINQFSMAEIVVK